MAISSGSLPVDSQQLDASVNQASADLPPSPTDHELEQAAREAESQALEVLPAAVTAESVVAAAVSEDSAALSKPAPEGSDRRRSRSRSPVRPVANYTLESPSTPHQQINLQITLRGISGRPHP